MIIPIVVSYGNDIAGFAEPPYLGYELTSPTKGPDGKFIKQEGKKQATEPREIGEEELERLRTAAAGASDGWFRLFVKSLQNAVGAKGHCRDLLNGPYLRRPVSMLLNMIRQLRLSADMAATDKQFELYIRFKYHPGQTILSSYTQHRKICRRLAELKGEWEPEDEMRRRFIMSISKCTPFFDAVFREYGIFKITAADHATIHGVCLE